MKYIKTFENKEKIEYSKGDIVICIANYDYEKQLVIGEKYYIQEIYNRRFDGVLEVVNDYIKNKNEIYVDAINSKLNQEVDKIFAYRFVSDETYREMEFQKDIKNFNL